MDEKKHFLYKDKNYAQQTHNRWIHGKVPQNRDMASDEFAENEELWLLQQCFKCQFYVPLQGILGMDWGACTNIESPFDAHVMFEHDGCEYHSLVSDEEL